MVRFLAELRCKLFDFLEDTAKNNNTVIAQGRGGGEVVIYHHTDDRCTSRTKGTGQDATASAALNRLGSV